MTYKSFDSYAIVISDHSTFGCFFILYNQQNSTIFPFHMQNQITYERSTSKILLKEFELNSISIAESYLTILDKIEEQD